MIAISLRSWIVGSALVVGVLLSQAATAASLDKAVRGLGGLSHQKVPDEEAPGKDHRGKNHHPTGDSANEHGESADVRAASHDSTVGPSSRTDGMAMPAPPPMTAAEPPVERAAPVQALVPVATAPGRPAEASQPASVSDEARAQAVINGEQKQAPPHPLQIAAPNDNVIVCEAGCGDARAHVVYTEPKARLRSVTADAPGSATALTGKTAECRGGCGYPGLSRSQPGFAMSGLGGPRGVNPELGAWMTTVSTAVEAPAAVPVKKSLREDWMARINRERDAKAATPSPAGQLN